MGSSEADFVVKGWQILISITALAFYSGMLTQRVINLEKWRAEIREDIHQVFEQIRKVESLIKEGTA